MTHEKKVKAQAEKRVEPGTDGLHGEEEGAGKSKIVRAAIKEIALCNAQEDAQFASRGYGGYIATEEIQGIRDRRQAAMAIVEKHGA